MLPQVLRETRDLLAEAWTGAARVPVAGGLSARPVTPGPSSRRSIAPVVARLARAGVTPDVVTIIGTLGAVAGAVVLFGTGHLFWGTVAVTFFVLLDLLDGALARARGGGTVFGAVLDSVGDRAADAAIFGALVWWFSGAGDNRLLVAARAALPGARRPDLLRQGAGRGRRARLQRGHRRAPRAAAPGARSAPASAGLGVPYALHVGLWVLLAGSAITVVQRIARRPPRGRRRGAAGAADARP